MKSNRRLKETGGLLTAVVVYALTGVSASAQTLNSVCTFRPSKEGSTKTDHDAWLRNGLVNCQRTGEHASILIIPAPDALESWSESAVAANLCDFTKAIAVIPTRSMHVASSRNQTHLAEATSVIVCALRGDGSP